MPQQSKAPCGSDGNCPLNFFLGDVGIGLGKGKEMRCILLALASLLLFLADGNAQTRVKIYVGEIVASDPSDAELIRSQFVKELAKIKIVELANTKQGAQFVLSAMGSVEGFPIVGTESRTVSAPFPNLEGEPDHTEHVDVTVIRTIAKLSTMMSDGAAGVIFLKVDKRIVCWETKCALRDAVKETVKDLKKKLKWK